MRTSRITLAALSLGLAAAVLSACSEPDAPPGPPPPAPVVVAHPAVKGIVEWHTYTGRLESVEAVEIRARVSGYIASTHFVEGELVSEGDLLFVIDPRPFEAQLKVARAAVAESLARVERSKALLAAAHAQRTRAQAEQALAASRLANAARALKDNAIAKEQFDERESEAAQARAAVLEVEAAVTAAEADIATTDAGVATARAAVEQAELDVTYTKVTAPISGRVGRRLVTRGNLIQGGSGGSTLLSTIVTVDPIHVYMDADEQAYLKYVRQARAGDRPNSRETKIPIYLSLVDEKGYPHKGYIDFVDNRLDAATGTMRARGLLRNTDLTLTPGLFATVRVPGSAKYDAILIPDSAIGADQARRFVYVVDEQGGVRPQPVELGPLTHGLRVVRSGLTGKEKIIIRGLQRVRPGAVVSPTLEALTVGESEAGLPDEFEPVPKSEWIELPSNGKPAGDK